MNSTRRNHAGAWLAGVAGLALALSGCGAPEVPTDKASGGDGWASPEAVQTALEAEGPVEVLDPVCCEGSIYAEVMQQVLTRAGGKASIKQIADITQHFPALASQNDGISPSIWDFSMPEQFEKYVEKEGTVSSIQSDIHAEEGWYVPTYMIEGDPDRGIEATCPELPDWQALNDCVRLFKTEETGDKGAFLTAGLEWAKYYGDEDRIKNLPLNFEIVFTGSDAALAATIKRKYDRGEPFVALAWSPHYVTLKFDLTRVEFPAYSDECWGDTYACNWPDITLFKIQSAKFPDEHPTAATIFENADLNEDDVKEMMIAIEEQGLSYTEAVEAWLRDNPERWQSWVPSEQG